MTSMSHSDMTRQQKNRALAIIREITGQDVQLDLGKKVSTPQDVMMEELSLQNNRGSLMYQQRQKRVQRFTFEYPENSKAAGKHLTSAQGASSVGDTAGTAAAGLVDGYQDGPEGKENYRTEVYIPASGKGLPPTVPKKSGKVLQMKKCQNPSAIAPGYSGPLTEVPHEKFNVTAIPKSYRSPWHEDLNSYENEVEVDYGMDLPEQPLNSLEVEYRSFNRAAMPFGGSLPNDRMYVLPMFEEHPPQPETPGSLELMCKRRSFNRAPRGWRMENIPESEDL